MSGVLKLADCYAGRGKLKTRHPKHKEMIEPVC